MQDRLTRLVLLCLVVLVAILVAQPYIDVLLFSASKPRTIEPRGRLADVERARIELFQRVAPSVVHVGGHAEPDAVAKGQTFGIPSGSGLIWDAAGHIVTNSRATRGAAGLSVWLGSGEVLSAEIVGTEANLDIAVLKVAAKHPLPPPVAVGRSAELRVGQSVFAIGNPFGFDHTLTSGVITAVKRRLPTSDGREISDVIQTDAAINAGNSGGPLLDSAGRLIGLNVSVFSFSETNSGIGFAIPVDVVNRVVPELIRAGKVPTAGIGIVAADDQTATQLGIQGVVVLRTLKGSPAERAGLHGTDAQSGTLGDVIVAANGKPVHRLADLVSQVEHIGVGNPIELTVERNGATTPLHTEVADVGPMR